MGISNIRHRLDHILQQRLSGPAWCAESRRELDHRRARSEFGADDCSGQSWPIYRLLLAKFPTGALKPDAKASGSDQHNHEWNESFHDGSLDPMAKVLLLTNTNGASAEVLPSLALLQHTVKIMPAEASVLIDSPVMDIVFVDARRELPAAKNLTRLLTSTGVGAPVIAITTEGGLSAMSADWGVDDVILDTAGPAEVDARIRICIGTHLAALTAADPTAGEIRTGDVVIDESTYTAKIKGRSLDLTFKEFELLKYLAQHPGRVFTRAQLLQEIWGYDYFGGTRTVDVHIRRLRSKLGPEFESIIGTVRNVGYRFTLPNGGKESQISERV